MFGSSGSPRSGNEGIVQGRCFDCHRMGGIIFVIGSRIRIRGLREEGVSGSEGSLTSMGDASSLRLGR